MSVTDEQSEMLLEVKNLSVVEKQSEVRIETVDFPKAVRENRCLVILGDPGAGKTTLMRFLAIQFARACLANNTKNVIDHDNNDYGFLRLPLYVRISQYATMYSVNKNASLRDFILGNGGEANVDKSLLRALFDDSLNGGTAFVLLDGLDEIVNPNDRSEIGRRIEQFASSCHAENRFIVTSRVAGYRAAQLGGEFAGHTLILRDLDLLQIEKFLRRWCLSVEYSLMPELPEHQIKSRAISEVEDILKSVSENIGVRRLAANPLMLTILALIHRNGARLPSRRIELYQLAVKTLLEDWELARGLPVENVVRETEAIRLLAPLAYWMHEHKQNGLASEREVKEKLAEVLAGSRGLPLDHPEIQDAIDDFLCRVREHTGVFVERAPNQYGFMHLTFEEYFAAREMVKRRSTSASNIYKYRHDSRWDEVISLAIAFESNDHPDDAQEYIQSAILAKGENARRQDFLPSLYENVLCRDLLFAVRVLGDCVGLESSFSRIVIEQLLIVWMDGKGRGRYEPLRERMQIALHSLRGSEAAAGVVMPALAALKDKDEYIRLGATDILGRLGQIDDLVIHALLIALKDNDEDVRGRAASALGQLGYVNDAVLGGLMAVLQDRYMNVRASAASALGQLGQANKEIISRLLVVLQDEMLVVRQSAVIALGQLRQADNTIISSLIDVLKDNDPSMRRSAAYALGRSGQVSDEIITALLAAMRDDNTDVHESVVYVFAQLRQSSDRLTDGLLEALNDPREYVRASAASLLGKLGKTDQKIIDRLFAALSDELINVRGSAAYSLIQLGQGSETVVNGLLEVMKNSNEEVRLGAVYALGQLGQVDDFLINGILEALRDDQDFVRRVAASALGQLGRASRAVIKGLLHALNDEEKTVSVSAASALVQLGYANEDLFVRLMYALEDEKEFVRGNAAVALGTLAGLQFVEIKSDLRHPIHEKLFAALKNVGDYTMVVVLGKYWLVSNHIWQALWDATTPVSFSSPR